MVVAAAGPTVTRNSPSGKRCSAISCTGNPSRAASRRAAAAAAAAAGRHCRMRAHAAFPPRGVRLPTT